MSAVRQAVGTAPARPRNSCAPALRRRRLHACAPPGPARSEWSTSKAELIVPTSWPASAWRPSSSCPLRAGESSERQAKSRTSRAVRAITASTAPSPCACTILARVLATSSSSACGSGSRHDSPRTCAGQRGVDQPRDWVGARHSRWLRGGQRQTWASEQQESSAHRDRRHHGHARPAGSARLALGLLNGSYHADHAVVVGIHLGGELGQGCGELRARRKPLPSRAATPTLQQADQHGFLWSGSAKGRVWPKQCAVAAGAHMQSAPAGANEARCLPPPHAPDCVPKTIGGVWHQSAEARRARVCCAQDRPVRTSARRRARECWQRRPKLAAARAARCT